MSPRITGLALLCSLTPRTTLADPARDAELTPGGVEVEARAHLGVATAPFDVSTLPEAKGQAAVFLLGTRTLLFAPLSLELRLPFVLGSVAQPAGSYLDAAAIGAPQLGARYRLLERRSAASILTFSGALALGAPLASHAEDLVPNRLLAVADGIEGRGNPEWFTPGVVPVTPSSAFSWAAGRVILTAELRMPLFVRVSDADLPSAMADTRSLGFATVLAGEARYRLSRRLSLASAAHLFVDVVSPVAHVRDVSPVQDFERVSLHVHFGSVATLSVDVQTAIGGELGGSMVAGGLRGTVNIR